MQTELTTTSILSLFDTTKSQRQTFVTDVLEKIENGEVNPIKVHAQLKKIEDIFKQLTGNDTYKKYLLDDVEKNGKKFEAFNAEFSVKEAGVKYDYSQCNDRELNSLMAAQETLDETVKNRQTFLKTVPVQGLEIRDGDELVTIYPPSKSSSTTVNVILK